MSKKRVKSGINDLPSILFPYIDKELKKNPRKKPAIRVFLSI